MRRGHPPLPVRLAVMLGSLALLLGLVGLVTFQPTGPRMPTTPRVVLVGIPQDALPVVTVTWTERTMDITQEARPGDRHRVWALPPLPEQGIVTLEVHDELTGLVLARKEVRPPHPSVIAVDVSGVVGPRRAPSTGR